MTAGASRGYLAALVLTLAARDAAAQAIVLQAGSSSLFNAHGASLEARGSSFSTSVSAGQLQGRLTVGALFKKQIRKVTFRAGDDVVDFLLPTDVFGGAHYVPVRGVGFERTEGPSHAMAMVGATSTITGAPFFRGAAWGTPAALLFLDRALGTRWHVFSRNTLSTRQTSINGVDWRPTGAFTAAAAAGVATGSAYMATSAALEREWLSAKAEYVRPHAAFSRVITDSPMAAEAENENLSATIHPHSWWSVESARQHFVNALTNSGPERATVNRIGGSVNVLGFRLNATVFDSPDGPFANRGASSSLARHVTDSLDVGVDHFRSVSKEGAVSSSLVTSLHETLNPRLSLVQVISTTGRQPSLNFGGEILTNPLTLSVSYQTVYAPFRIGNPFVQALGIDLRLQPIGNLQLRVGTYTSPDGHLRYTISGSDWLSPAGSGRRARPRALRLAKYLVRGQVIDAAGDPVDGAALRIGHEDVLTDREGRFFLRAEKKTPVDFSVLTEEFSAPGHFTVVSAPTNVTPAVEDRAFEILVVVSRR